jgi:hypothetical protein
MLMPYLESREESSSEEGSDAILAFKPTAKKNPFWILFLRRRPCQLTPALNNSLSLNNRKISIQYGWNVNASIQVARISFITNVQIKHQAHEIIRLKMDTPFGGSIFNGP